MPSMFSRTVAVLRWTAKATIVFVTVWSIWPVLAVLRRSYFDAILVFTLSSSRVKEATIWIVVLATLTVFERS